MPRLVGAQKGRRHTLTPPAPPAPPTSPAVSGEKSGDDAISVTVVSSPNTTPARAAAIKGLKGHAQGLLTVQSLVSDARERLQNISPIVPGFVDQQSVTSRGQQHANQAEVEQIDICGPTECAVDATAVEITLDMVAAAETDGGKLPIGKPIDKDVEATTPKQRKPAAGAAAATRTVDNAVKTHATHVTADALALDLSDEAADRSYHAKAYEDEDGGHQPHSQALLHVPGTELLTVNESIAEDPGESESPEAAAARSQTEIALSVAEPAAELTNLAEPRELNATARQMRAISRIQSFFHTKRTRKEFNIMKHVASVMQTSLRSRWLRTIREQRAINVEIGPADGDRPQAALLGGTIRLGHPSNIAGVRGTTPDYGSIEFDGAGGKPMSPNERPFVRVDEKVATGEQLTNLLMYHWQIFACSKPGAMVSVLGSTSLEAHQLGLSLRQCKLLERGLIAFATSVRACITSLGAEKGVAKLVGEAARTFDPHGRVPCIGICPWGCVESNRVLEGTKGEKRVYSTVLRSTSKPNSSIAPPQSDHTHFIFVDHGGQKDSAFWGAEATLRTSTEKAFAVMNKLPIIHVVIGGGLGTLDTVCAALRSGSATVVVEGSGGVADAIASTYNAIDKLSEAFGDLLPKQGRQREIYRLQKVLHDAKKLNLISIFNAVESDARNFDEVLMRSTINRLKFTPLQKLNKFISWGRSDMVCDLLEEFRSDPLLHRKMFELTLRKTIRQRKAGIAEVILAKGTEVFGKAFGTTIDHGLRLSIPDLYSVTPVFSDFAISQGSDHITPDGDALDEPVPDQSLTFESSASNMFEVVAPADPEMDEYKKPFDVLARKRDRISTLGSGQARKRNAGGDGGVSPAARRHTLRRRKSIISLKSTRSVHATNRPHMRYPRQVVNQLVQLWPNFAQLKTLESINSLHILLWACTMCDPEMVQIFWRRTANPLETALIASMLCKQLTNREGSRASRATLVTIAHSMEACAKELMEKCTTGEDAAMILRRKSTIFNVYVAEIAVLNNEAEIADAVDTDASSWSMGEVHESQDASEAAFLAHPYCGATLEDIWCGYFLRTGHGTDGLWENLLIALQVCSPFRKLLPDRLLRHRNVAWKYLDFVQVPKVKFVAHNCAYALFLVSYLVVLSGISDFMWLIFGFWIFGLTMDEVLDFRETEGLSHFSSFVNVLDAGSYITMHIVLAIRLAVTTGMYTSSVIYMGSLLSIVAWQPKLFKSVCAVGLAHIAATCTGLSGLSSWVGPDTLTAANCVDADTRELLDQASMKILSIVVVLVFFRLFSVLTASGPVGVMVITVVKMVNVRFQSFAIMSIYLIISFAAAFAGIALANEPVPSATGGEGNDGFIAKLTENLVALAWAFIGSDRLETDIDDDFARESLSWIYVLLAQLLLANGVLIALLTDTYESVRDRAYGESVMNRLSMLHEFMCKHWLPPPLTAPIILLFFLRGNSEGEGNSDDGKEIDESSFWQNWRQAMGGLMDMVTSREAQLHMASHTVDGHDYDDRTNAIESQAMRRYMRGRPAVTQPVEAEEEEEDPIETALAGIRVQIDELQRSTNRKLHDLSKRLAEQYDSDEQKLKRQGSRRMLQKTASKVKLANRLVAAAADAKPKGPAARRASVAQLM